MNIVNPGFPLFVRLADAAPCSRAPGTCAPGLDQDPFARAGGQVDTYAPSSPANEAGIYSPDQLRRHSGFRTMNPIVASEGDAVKAADTNPTDTSFDDRKPDAQRAAFVEAMEASLGKGKVGNPPTQAQLMAYFKTFNSPEKRAQARVEFEKYCRAFYIHAGLSDGGDQNSDVKYSAETTYVVAGKVFASKSDAEREARAKNTNGIKLNTADPSRWSDITRQPKNGSDHRTIIDCEGYAYMAGVLLGAAGYQPTMISTGQGPELHAMALLTDPGGGESVVVSNSRTFSGPAGSEDRLLQEGWSSTAARGPSGGFHKGETVSKATVAQVVAEEARARAESEAFERRLRQNLEMPLDDGAW